MGNSGIEADEPLATSYSGLLWLHLNFKGFHLNIVIHI